MTPENIFTARYEQLVIQKLENEVLVYDLRNNKMFCLNETSAQIYQMCDGKNSVTEISRKLSGNSKQEVSEDLVWLAIDQLKSNDLLDKSAEIKSKFKGLSRREAIRKVGFVSLAALPVITSITAPAAALAASTCTPCTATVPFGQSCGLPGGCAASNYLNYDVVGCSSGCSYCECRVSLYATSCSSVCRVRSQYQ